MYVFAILQYFGGANQLSILNQVIFLLYVLLFTEMCVLIIKK